MKQLSKDVSNIVKQVGTQYPIKVLQFGGGNFLRAYADWMIDILNAETDFAGAVAVVKPTPHGNYDALKNQDGLFHTQLYSMESGELNKDTRLISCIQRIINPYVEFDDYLALADEQDLRFVISNTTESGIAFVDTDKFDDKPALSFPAKLTQFLFKRFTYFKGDVNKGVIVLPLELIEDNAKTLKQYVFDYIDLWSLGADFKRWLEESNYFYNTLVDRIVTGFPKETAQETWKEIGFQDELLVQGESYYSWVIEVDDASIDSLKQELPFDKTRLNIEFTSDLSAYYDRKVGILNGTHTALVPIGILAGYSYVHEAIEDNEVGDFIELMLKNEVLPRLDLPQENLLSFTQDCLNRFKNPVLQHQLKSIALNSTHKFKTRLLPSLLAYSEVQETVPKRIVFAFACLIRFYKGEWQGKSLPLQDDEAIIVWWDSVWQSTDVVDAVLKEESLWGQDLRMLPDLQDTLSHFLKELETQEVVDILKTL